MYTHAREIFGHCRNAVGLFHAKFGRIADRESGIARGAEHCQYGNFVDQRCRKRLVNDATVQFATSNLEIADQFSASLL